MGMPEQVGANLEQLYKGGTTELPPIATAFTNAGNRLAATSASSVFSHHAGLGLGSSGPCAAYDELREAIASSAKNSGQVMQDVADAVVLTAQRMAATDQAIRDAFIAHGGKL